MLPAVDLPVGVRLLVVDGCTNCDGPPTGLYSVERASGGTYAVEKLYGLALAKGRAQTADGQYITAFVADETAMHLAVGVCVRGGCGPLGTVDRSAQVAVSRSDDGGRTWRQIATVEGGSAAPQAVTSTDVFVATTQPDSAGAFESAVVSLASGTKQVPPPGENRWLRAVLPDGTALWGAEHGGTLLRSDGKTYVNVRDPAVDYVYSTSRSPDGKQWFEWKTKSPENAFFGAIGPGGMPSVAIEESRSILSSGRWLDASRLVVDAGFDQAELTLGAAPAGGWSLPAILDVVQATLTPIGGPFAAPPFAAGRNQVIAVVAKP